MRLVPALLALTVAATQVAAAQRPEPRQELLDRMTGHWVLRGTIGRKETTHDVAASWVLNREYLQIRETSREKDAKGRPAYDAIIYIAWDAKQGEYAVLWLDNTAAYNFSGENIGHAKPESDRLQILFRDPAGGADHTTFAYDRKADAWAWTIDSESKGKTTRFADVKLTRN